MVMLEAYEEKMRKVGLYKTTVRHRERTKSFLKLRCRWEDGIKRHVKYPNRCQGES